MPERPYILAETTWKTVKDTPYEVVILPWGAVEAHNKHLPYATDIIETDFIVAESARIAWEKGCKVVVLPTVPFGVNTGQQDIKCDINMNPSTQAAVLRDIVDSLHRQGLKKLVILNGHGGNDFRQMIREIQSHYNDFFLCTVCWYHALDNNQFFTEPGDHAGEMETSLMLHLVPELVLPLTEAGDGAERRFRIQGLAEGLAWAQRDWNQITKDTGVGNPAKATVEKGERFFQAVTQKIGDFFVELGNCELDQLYE